MRRIYSHTQVIVVAALLSGCTLYQKPDVPPLNAPERFEVNIPQAHELLNDHWWENFNNPQLNALIEKSLENNYNYLVALKNIDIAQDYVLQSMSLLFPQATADLENSRNKQIITVGSAISAAPDVTGKGNIFNLQTLTGTLTYQIDVWNQVHNTVNQAKANLDSAQGNTDVIKLTLLSSVASTYFQIMALNQDIENLKAQHKAAVEIVELYQVQNTAGLIDSTAVYTASTQAETVLSTLNLTIKQKQIALYTLAYLLGEYPEGFTIEPEGKVSDIRIHHLIPEGIPSAVVGMRPDIQSAYGQIMAFGYLEKQNIANFLPNFTLTGTYGYASAVLAGLIKHSNAIWSYGLSTLQTLMDYPGLVAQYQISKHQFEQAILAYKNTVQNAYVQVDSALESYREDDFVLHSFKIEQDNAANLFEIAQAHYHSGLTDYIDYSTNELVALQADYNLTNQQLIVTQDIIQVYVSLGLGLQASVLQ